MPRLHVYAVAIFLVLSCVSSSDASTQDNGARSRPEINFTVSMSKPNTHLFEVEMILRDAHLPPVINLVMPVWTPGSYLVREFERHLQDFAAKDAAGLPLAWQKINKDTWRVDAKGAREVRVTYRVYANELSVRTNDLDDRHGYFNNAALLLYPDGHLSAPSTLRVVPFDDWKVATGLPAVSGTQNTFRAENFDVLYDSPVEVGEFKTVSFQVRNVPHRIVIDGEGNYDVERIRRDVQKIVMTQADLMGELPYKDYTFILHAHSRADGGLEHLNSSSIIMERNSFLPEERYKAFLSIVSHEFFHVWNVKRIRPDALGPFNYTQENYTKLLWVAEGITEYYGGVMLRRAGLTSDREFFSDLSGSIGGLQNTPGRFLMSAEEASFDAWIKYYDKGQLLGLLLDLQIRKLSGGTKSLDDVMRYLYAEYYKKNRNYSPEDFQRAAELIAGSSLQDFFTRFVRGREELDYNSALNVVGLQLGETGPPPRETPYLGADVIQEGDRLNVRRVLSGTPAYDQGIYAGDQIVAFDGLRVNQQSYLARLSEKHPGDTIILTVFRDDALRGFIIKVGGRVLPDFRIMPVQQPTPEQIRQYRAWLGA